MEAIPQSAAPMPTLPNPSAVVGERICLTPTPDASTLAALPIPLTLSTTAPTTWTVTRRNEYRRLPPTRGRLPTGSVTPMTATAQVRSPLLLRLSRRPVWPLTYAYCVSGQTTCPNAAATFSVTGPTGGTMSFTPVSPAVTIANLTTCIDSRGNTWPGGPWMSFATGVTGSACPGRANYPAFGINFNEPTGYENDSDGSYELVQLIASDTTTGESIPPSVAGLDTDFPYGIPPTSDSPKVYLQPTATSVSRTFSANMFLMWQSNTTGSIPVPLGYQNWGFSGTATCSASCDTAANWTATNTPGTTPGPVGDFVRSSPSQTQTNDGKNILAYGYPTWTSISQ